MYPPVVHATSLCILSVQRGVTHGGCLSRVRAEAGKCRDSASPRQGLRQTPVCAAELTTNEQQARLEAILQDLGETMTSAEDRWGAGLSCLDPFPSAGFGGLPALLSTLCTPGSPELC